MGHVSMAIDKAGKQELSGSVNDRGAGWDGQSFTKRQYFANAIARDDHGSHGFQLFPRWNRTTGHLG